MDGPGDRSAARALMLIRVCSPSASASSRAILRQNSIWSPPAACPHAPPPRGALRLAPSSSARFSPARLLAPVFDLFFSLLSVRTMPIAGASAPHGWGVSQ